MFSSKRKLESLFSIENFSCRFDFEILSLAVIDHLLPGNLQEKISDDGDDGKNHNIKLTWTQFNQNWTRINQNHPPFWSKICRESVNSSMDFYKLVIQ